MLRKNLEELANQILLRPGHSGTFSAVLIVFGHYIYWVCRYLFSTEVNGCVNISPDCCSDKTRTFLLQVMLIIAWEGISVMEIFSKDVLYNLSSIFITAAVLRLLQSMTDLLRWLCFRKFIIPLSEELVSIFFNTDFCLT